MIVEVTSPYKCPFKAELTVLVTSFLRAYTKFSSKGSLRYNFAIYFQVSGFNLALINGIVSYGMLSTKDVSSLLAL